MTDKALYYKVIRHDKIYSLLYSPIRIKEESLEDQIIEIPLTELEWAKDYKSFVYVWGWPGPDYNKYDASTYGKGWGFTKQKIIDSWREIESK